MTQRSLNKSHPGKWESPGGGSQVGETGIETAIRELSEEVGIVLDNKDLIYLDTKLYKHQFVDIFCSYKKINCDEIVLQKEEVSAFKFVSKEEFTMMEKDNEIVISNLDRFYLIKDRLHLDW